MSFFGFSILDLKKTIHFTSLPFPWRPPCLLLRGYDARVVWGGMYREHIWCGGVVVLLWRCLWRCLYIYLENGEMGENGEKKNLPWLTWDVVVVGVVSCARFSCTPRCGRIRIRVRSRFRRLRSPSSRSHRHRCRRRYIRRCAAEIGG